MPAMKRAKKPAKRTKMNETKDIAKQLIEQLREHLPSMPLDAQVDLLNSIRRDLHDVSPFRAEPVDLVVWQKSEKVTANDYNPNAVAPPEMALLEISIAADGFTQPIVTDLDEEQNIFVVVDGFHRNRVGRESEAVRAKVQGYLPLVQIRSEQSGRCERIASTIRHNRARGKHQVESMSQIVLELKRRNWSDSKIGHELGMDPDEVLRLAQITGLAEAFKDRDFSLAWEVDQQADDETVLAVAEEIDDEG